MAVASLARQKSLRLQTKSLRRRRASPQCQERSAILCPQSGGLRLHAVYRKLVCCHLFFHPLFLGALSHSVSPDVLDEGAKLRHDLMSPWMIKEYAGSERSKRLQQAQQFAFRDKLRRHGARHLSQPYSSNGGTD